MLTLITAFSPLKTDSAESWSDKFHCTVAFCILLPYVPVGTMGIERGVSFVYYLKHLTLTHFPK